MTRLPPFVLFVLVFLLAHASIRAHAETARSQVIRAGDVQWGHLNPLRGDKSPGAADLWGDRTQDVATGMLVRFNKGFSSPPDIHNISYRGIVIAGQLHNDDPQAETQWMPPGSFWTQPAGDNHITAANGDTNIIYLEIDHGPYLVKPTDQHFDNGEWPINLHETNLVWLDHKDLTFINTQGIELATLWQSNEPDGLVGYMMKLPAGFSGHIHTDATEFRAVVIKGGVAYESNETTEPMQLAPGSYIGSEGEFQHRMSAVQPAWVYVRVRGRFEVVSQ